MSAPAVPPLRVEVVPVGYYLDRVVVPIIQHNSDRVYFLRARDDRNDSAKGFREEATRQLRKWKPRLDIRVVRTELWDLLDAVESFSGVIGREVEAGNSVWVNLSTGSKLEAVAAALACMAHGANPYYVRMRSYERGAPREPLATGVGSVDPVPCYAIRPPSELGLAIMTLLSENRPGLSKKEILEGLADSQLIPTTRKDGREATPQAAYGRLQAALDELGPTPGLITIQGVRKSGRVQITLQGLLALRLFSPRLPR